MNKHQRYNLKNPPVAFRLSPIYKKAIKKAADKENISSAQIISRIVQLWLKDHKYIIVKEEICD